MPKPAAPRLPDGIFLAALFAGAVWAHQALERAAAPPPLPSPPLRIVSLAPSITETLYALGLGEKIAGVTEFCAYPPDAADKPRVAGFSEVNYEAVLRTMPDLVVLPSDKERNRRNLELLGLPVLGLDTLSLSGFIGSVEILGRATGTEARAGELLAGLRKSMDEARRRAEGKPRPRVLFSVMRAYQGLGYITEITAVGEDGFYSEMIRTAGGENVYSGPLPFPRLSREALIFLDPDVIIDVIPSWMGEPDTVRADWRGLEAVRAVRGGRIFLLTDNADTVPGPRFPITLNKLSVAFHPETALP